MLERPLRGDAVPLTLRLRTLTQRQCSARVPGAIALPATPGAEARPRTIKWKHAHDLPESGSISASFIVRGCAA